MTAWATADATVLSNRDGMICVGVGWGWCVAIACAAAMKCFCSNCVILASNAPLMRPGKASTLLIWLGKSLLPVARIKTPAWRARCGSISGLGLERANTMGWWFICWMCPGVRMLALLTPIKTSALMMTSSKLQHWSSLLSLWVASL